MGVLLSALRADHRNPAMAALPKAIPPLTCGSPSLRRDRAMGTAATGNMILRQSAQAELARVARLTTMGELVASIAHEINQPWPPSSPVASACLRWLNRDQPDLDAARKCRVAHRAGRHARRQRDPQPAGACQEIRAATRPSSTSTTPSRKCWRSPAATCTQHGVALHTDLSAGDRPVFGDRVQLQQVLLNLIMNGIEAMGAVTDRPKVLTIPRNASNRRGVLVAVEDTGTGLDPATADRIFDPFFTTKPSGMGMGLSICRSIIDAHGERFWASSNTPHGAIFQFTLPANEPSASKQATSSS